MIDFMIYKRLPLVLKNMDKININENVESTFVVNKGEKMELCIKDKDGKVHKRNTIKYVLIHEISHMINIEYGHGTLF